MDVSPVIPEPAPRVGYVVKKYPRLSETFILNEILGLEERGIDVRIFSLRPPDDGRFHAALARVKATVHYLPPFKTKTTWEAFEVIEELGPEAKDGLGPALELLGRLPESGRTALLVQALHLARELRRSGITHLHAHFMTVAAQTAFVAHQFSRVPFSVTAHAKDIYLDTVDKEMFSRIAADAVAVVTVCDANARYLRDDVLGSSGATVRRIYNGIPPRAPADGPAADPQLVLAVGRLVEKKGFHLLVDACRRLRDEGTPFRCVIIGDGAEREALRHAVAAARLEDRVEIPGPMPAEQVIDWMRRARVLAAPCLVGADGNRDALPTVLIEALSVGLPMVTTPVGGIPEIVDQGVDGLVVAEGDAGALASGLARILGDDALHGRLAAAGPVKVRERFDRDRTLQELIEVFGISRTVGVAR